MVTGNSVAGMHQRIESRSVSFIEMHVYEGKGIIQVTHRTWPDNGCGNVRLISQAGCRVAEC